MNNGIEGLVAFFPEMFFNILSLPPRGSVRVPPTDIWGKTKVKSLSKL